MHGRAHTQVTSNLKVLPLGDGKFTWHNTSNGYVANGRWDSYDEAQEAIDKQLAYEQSLQPSKQP